MLMFLPAGERILQLVQTGCYQLDGLLLPNEDSIYIYDICPDSDAYFVADDASRCVKLIAPSKRPVVTSIYQCGQKLHPRALQLLPPVAGGGTTLLLVEWLEDGKQTECYSLVVAERSGETVTVKKRIPLTALSKGERLDTVSMATTSGGFVLIGNSGAKSLEVIDTRKSSGIIRLAKPLPLDFKLSAFSLGTVDGRELMAATEVTTRIVHILQVEMANGAPKLRSLPTLTVGDENHQPLDRVLLFGSHVLLNVRHKSSGSHVVECLPISGSPQSSEPSQVLSVEQQVRISCWRAADNRVLFFDVNHKQISILECVSCGVLYFQYVLL